jgi:thiamine-monophosphate kinase
LSVAAIGRIAKGRAVLRSGALAGDLVYVSGTLGDAALGLLGLAGKLAGVAPTGLAYLADRYRLPQPRLALGQRLVGLVHAMMDVSDGLVADLGHLCRVSRVAAAVEVALLPLSDAGRAAVAAEKRHIAAVLGGGDDYELLFTAPPASAGAIAELARQAGVAVTAIGRIESGTGVRVLDDAGKAVDVAIAGYRHF